MAHMIRSLSFSLVFSVVLLGMAGERPIVKDKAEVRVQFQYRSPGGQTWGTSETMLRGAVSESMMRNQISVRYPGREVRILAAVVNGRTTRVRVTYQAASSNGTWSSGTTTLQNALTASMARNQLSMRYPGRKIKILSMVRE